jgi:hypothetical protein
MAGEAEEPMYRREESTTTMWADRKLQKRDKRLMQMKKKNRLTALKHNLVRSLDQRVLSHISFSGGPENGNPTGRRRSGPHSGVLRPAHERNAETSLLASN